MHVRPMYWDPQVHDSASSTTRATEGAVCYASGACYGCCAARWWGAVECVVLTAGAPGVVGPPSGCNRRTTERSSPSPNEHCGSIDPVGAIHSRFTAGA